MTSYTSSRQDEGVFDDSKSGNSTLPLRDHTTIRKTTEIEVSR